MGMQTKANLCYNPSMRFRNLKKQSNKNNQIKEDKRTKFKYARYPDRIKAFITDMFMIYIPILYVITYVALDGKDSFQESTIGQSVGVSIYGFVYAAFLAKSGQTPGKKAYIIKVVDIKTGDKISFLRALLRFIAFLFTAATLLGLLLPLVRKDNRMLHDLLVNTVVINIEE